MCLPVTQQRGAELRGSPESSGQPPSLKRQAHSSVTDTSPVINVDSVRGTHLTSDAGLYMLYTVPCMRYTHRDTLHTLVYTHTHTHRYTVHTHRLFSREFNFFDHLFKSFSSSLSTLIHSRWIKLPSLVFSLSNLKHHWGLHKLCFHQEIFLNNLLPSVSPESLSIFTG